VTTPVPLVRTPRAFTDLARWYHGLGLRARFALHIVGSTILLLFGLIMPAVVYLQTQASLQQARRHSLEQTRVFAHASVQSLVMDDFLAMRHIVNSIASDPEVLYVMIHDRQGKLLVHSDMRRVGEVLSDPLTAAAVRARTPLVQVVPGGSYAEDFTVPVYVMNETPAVARIGISFADEMAHIKQTRYVVLAVGLFALGAGVMLARLQARSVTRPVAQLVEAADAVTKGRLEHRIPEGAGGEMGQLAAAFNRMTGSVQALIETSRDLSSSLDIEAVLGSIARHARELVGADAVAIATIEGEDRSAQVRVVLGGRTREFSGLSIAPGRGLGGLVLETGEPQLTGDYQSDPRFTHDAVLDRLIVEEAIASVLAVPIRSPRGVVGLIMAGSRPAAAFTPEDLDSLLQMARQAAIAMENARLYEGLKRSHEALSAAQDELVRQTRMAAIGQIAAAVAHEIRNPLSALSTCVQLLQRDLPAGSEDAELIQIIHTESRRLNEIVSDFLTFGRPRPPRWEAVQLSDVIQGAIALLQRDPRCSPAIAFDLVFDPTLPAVPADRDQLHQVFWNLCLNAVQAMGPEGKLRAETGQVDGQAVVRIEDTGPGIPGAARSQIFDPFYTTKAGGIGLGLAIVRRIVEDHGGRIAVESSQERGTCFTLTVPLEQKQTPSDAS
jgi:signal transduction histidine kinase/HAMP domain-containing protein